MSFFSQLITIFMLPSHMWSSWRVSPLLSSVIVSQWTSMLQIVAVHLQLMGLTYSVIDGTVNPKRRMDLVEEFNTNPKGPQVNVSIFVKWSMSEWSRLGGLKVFLHLSHSWWTPLSPFPVPVHFSANHLSNDLHHHTRRAMWSLDFGELHRSMFRPPPCR